jgi:hypothetical protein
MAKRKGIVQIDGIEDAVKMLSHVDKTMRSPQVIVEIQHGADLMAASAQRKARRRTGGLAKGVYTASQVRYNKPVVTRQVGRHTQDIVQKLHSPPVKGQVLIVAGTFYGRWVEKGRKPRGAMLGPGYHEGSRHERRGVGRTPRRPFFKPGIKEAQPMAESFIKRRLERLIQEAAT